MGKVKKGWQENLVVLVRHISSRVRNICTYSHTDLKTHPQWNLMVIIPVEANYRKDLVYTHTHTHYTVQQLGFS